MIGQQQDVHGISSNSSISEGRQETHFDATTSVGESGDGETTSSFEGQSNSLAVSNTGAPNELSQVLSGGTSQHNSADSQTSIRSSTSMNLRPWEKNISLGVDSRSVVDSVNGGEERSSSDGVGSLTNRRNSHKFRRKGPL